MNSDQTHKLYLIPNLLFQGGNDDEISESIRKSVHHLKRFIVEDEKSARALIKKLQIATHQNDLQLMKWNEHSTPDEKTEITDFMKLGDTGIISEAGLPCVADPGSDLVMWAHKNNIEVIPLSGASSFMLALMGSGLNGQSFVFHGYLPIEKNKRAHQIKELGIEAEKKNRSQIVMDAPYRNNQLMDELIKNLSPGIKICVACNLTAPDGWIKTRTVSQWTTHKPELHKKPVVFIVGR